MQRSEAYHPTHSMNVPIMMSTLECPGIGCGVRRLQHEIRATPEVAAPGSPVSKVGSNLPLRGPMIAAPHREATPPRTWTAPPPAKSMTPPRRAFGLLGDAHPLVDHCQWATTG